MEKYYIRASFLFILVFIFCGCFGNSQNKINSTISKNHPYNKKWPIISNQDTNSLQNKEFEFIDDPNSPL